MKVPKVVKIPDNSIEESSTMKVPKAEEMPDNSITKRTVKLRAKEAREIYVQAWKAFQAFRFAEKKVVIADGMHVTLQLRATGRVLEMQVFNIGEIEKESPELARLFLLMEKYLSKAH